jgi:hypothetical protein
MSDSSEVNPYASPAIAAELADATEPKNALRLLRGPSLGLLVLGGFVAIGGIVFLPLMFLGLILALLFPRYPPPGGIDSLIMVPMFLASYPIVYGAWSMRSGRSYRWAYAAAVLACIPVISPLIYFCIPLGIWALIVLHRRDVKEAFARNAEQRKNS